MSNLNEALQQWEKQLAEAREVCKISGDNSPICEESWNAVSTIDLHMHHAIAKAKEDQTEQPAGN
jgi:CP12 domain